MCIEIKGVGNHSLCFATKEKCMDNLKEWIEEVLNENGCHLYDLETAKYL